MQVSLCGVAQVDQVWPALREGLQRALLRTGGDMVSGDLWSAVRSGNAFLLVAHEGDKILGASVWRSETWQSGVKLRCLALFGVGMKSWIGEMRELAVRIAHDCGATSLVSEGRAGWQKVFPAAKVLRLLYEEQIT